MCFQTFTTTAVCSLLIGIGWARPVWAVEIRVLNANALTVALRELAAEHTKHGKSGHLYLRLARTDPAEGGRGGNNSIY